MKEGIVDFHAHAFPDELAGRAVPYLEKEGNIKARLDGTISSLLRSMDRSGIEKSVVNSIATKPSQFSSILTWSKKIRSERIIPFPSVHPGDPMLGARISQVKREGFKGIKLHPYYQEFSLDEERLVPLYEKVCEENLILALHTGFDIAFPPIKRADPMKIEKLKERFPAMKLVATHLGAWKQWAEVERHLVGKEVYMEISFALEFLKREEARNIILNHPKEYILFGSDTPWTDQQETVSLLKNLGLGQKREGLILRDNSLRLLDSV